MLKLKQINKKTNENKEILLITIPETHEGSLGHLDESLYDCFGLISSCILIYHIIFTRDKLLSAGDTYSTNQGSLLGIELDLR